MEEPHRTHKESAWGWLGALGLIGAKMTKEACSGDRASRCRAKVKKPTASVAQAGPYAP